MASVRSFCALFWTRKRTASRWPLRAALCKGVMSVSGRKRTAPTWPLRAATCKVANPGCFDCGSISAHASSNSRMGSTCPCSAASTKGIMPQLVFGLRGHLSNVSRASASFLLAADIICMSSATSGGQNSKTTSWSLTGAEAKTSSSEISAASPSRKSLCLNLVAPILAAKACFTALADFPSNSAASSTAALSPDAKKHTSIAC